MGNHHSDDVSVLVIDGSTTIARLDSSIHLELTGIISKTTIGTDDTFGDLDGVAEDVSLGITGYQDILTKFHILGTQKTVRGKGDYRDTQFADEGLGVCRCHFR